MSVHGYQGNIFYTVVDPSVPYMPQPLHSLGLGSMMGRVISAMKWSSIGSSNEFLTSGHPKIAKAVLFMLCKNACISTLTNVFSHPPT